MKRKLFVVLMLVSVLSLSACGSKDEQVSDKSASSSVNGNTIESSEEAEGVVIGTAEQVTADDAFSSLDFSDESVDSSEESPVGDETEYIDEEPMEEEEQGYTPNGAVLDSVSGDVSSGAISFKENVTAATSGMSMIGECLFDGFDGSLSDFDYAYMLGEHYGKDININVCAEVCVLLNNNLSYASDGEVVEPQFRLQAVAILRDLGVYTDEQVSAMSGVTLDSVKNVIEELHAE